MTNDIQQKAVEEFRKKLENEFKLTDTQFKCIDINGKTIVLNSKEVPAGTLIDYGDKREAFRALAFDEHDKPWVSYTNLKMSHKEFAEMMRSRSDLPRIIYWGL